MPVLPALALLSGFGLRALIKVCNRAIRRSKSGIIPVALIVFLVFFSIFNQAGRSIRHIQTITLPHTWNLANNWINNNIPEDKSIYIDYHRSYFVSPHKIATSAINPSDYSQIMPYNYFVTDEASYKRYIGLSKDHLLLYLWLFENFELVKEFRSEEGVTTGPVISILKINAQALRRKIKEDAAATE